MRVLHWEGEAPAEPRCTNEGSFAIRLDGRLALPWVRGIENRLGRTKCFRLLSSRYQGAEDEVLRGCRCLLWVSLLTVAASGCFSSKWAMDHADYRKKYEQPYSENPIKKWGRMAKQMLDARHVSGDSGWYIGGAGSNFRDNAAVGFEAGETTYSTPWLSSKVGLAGQLNSGASNGFVGVNTSVNVSTPTRVAPFVGAGLFGGVDVATVVNAINDEESTHTTFLGAAYPEAGVHVWLNGRTRLSASASYWVTTSAHDRDFWYYGLGLTFNFGPDGRRVESGELLREDELVNRLLDEREQRETVDRTPTSDLPDIDVQATDEVDAAFPPLNLPPPPSR